MLRLSVFVVIWFVTFMAVSQMPVTFERFTTTQGLPQNSIFSITQDADGFIWVATYDGLSRFDGSHFYSYKPEPGSGSGLSSNITVSISADPYNRIWIGTTGSGLSMFDTKTLRFENYQANTREPLAISNNDILSILPQTNGIWVGTGLGLNLFDVQKSGFYSCFVNDGLVHNQINALLQSLDGQVWVATPGGMQRVGWHNGRFSFYETIPIEITGGAVRQIFRDSEERIWTVSATQVSVFINDDDGQLRMMKRLVSGTPGTSLENISEFNVITQRAKGEFWVGTQNGLLRIQEQSDKLIPLLLYQSQIYDDRSLPGNQVVSIFTDAEGVLWIGTRFNGLAKYDPYKQPVTRFMRNPGHPNTLHSNDVRAVIEDAAGNVWVGSRNQGLDFINSTTGEITHYEHSPNDTGGLPNNGIRALYLDNRNSVWVGYYGGFSLIAFDGQGKARFFAAQDDKGQPIQMNGFVYSFFEDTEGVFWVGTSNGLMRYCRDTGSYRWIRNLESEGNWGRSNFIRSIGQDGNDDFLWLATDGEGIYRLNKETFEFLNFRQELGNSNTLSHNKVYSIACDKNGQLWFGTHSGLNRYCSESGNFIHYTREHGLSNDIVYGILPDNRGNLWITTANGLSRFNPKTGLFKTYLNGFEFSDDAYSVNRNGKIYVGGLNGFFAFHPDSLKENQFVPPICFTSLRLYNQLIEPNKEVNGRVLLPLALQHMHELVINYFETFFSVEFAALSYASPAENRYQYRLEGLHSQWIETSQDNRIAAFSNLKPGVYELRVRGANPDGVWGENALIIRVLPAFYQTNWFRALMVLFFVASIFSFYRLRIRSLTKQKLKLQTLVDEKTEILLAQNSILQEQRDEIASQRDKVMEMTRLVHEADERKLRFFTNISHEIRTPLTLILGAVEQLYAQSQLSGLVKENLNRIHRNAETLHKLINQLLDLRKIDNGLMPLELNDGEMVSFVGNKVDLFRTLASQKGITLSYNTNFNEMICRFDHDIVDKVITNLLSNAIKYSGESGKVDISLELTKSQGAEFVLIGVKDNGGGIPPSEQSRIFDRFYRIKDIKQNKASGSGIGLALARDLALVHGGELSLVHSDDNGSLFALKIPYQVEVPNDVTFVSDAIDQVIPALENHSENDFEPFSILVIEDNDDLRRFICDGLKGFKVIEAANGEDGLNIAFSELPDLIISDVLMPVKNGFEVCHELKSSNATAHIPVLLLTALGAAEHQMAGFDCGADDYMVKPFNLTLLSLKVRNILNARQRYREIIQVNLSSDAEAELPDDPFIRSVYEVIHNNIENSGFGVEELGIKMNLSRSTFYRKIKTLTGLAPVALLRMLRVREAAKLLRTQPLLSVGEIAMKTGFEDVDYFRDCFKKQFGVTPTEFQNRK